MLDWAEQEKIILPKQKHGWEWYVGLPGAKYALTKEQKGLAEWFVKCKDDAKAVGIHAGIVSPLSSWSKEELIRGYLTGVKLKDGKDTVVRVSKKPDGSVIKERVVPIKGMNVPPEEATRFPAIIETTRGSIFHHRDWFIGQLQKHGVAIVFSGHAHRNSVLVVSRKQYRGLPKGTAFALKGNIPEMFRDIENVHGPIGPMFLNTTSAGPASGDRITPSIKKKVPPAWVEVVLTS